MGVNTYKGVIDPLGDPTDGHILTRAIIDTIREPLIVIDEQLRIIAASRSFYNKFGQSAGVIQGTMFYDLGNGQWNIPALRKLLENVIPKHRIVENYEVEHNFPTLGQRIMLVNAREVRYKNGHKKMLLSIFDVTEQRAFEVERDNLIEQKDILLQEMRHRIANSLQIIASILLLKADTVDSPETRTNFFEDAHERIMSIASAQQQLNLVNQGKSVPVANY